MRSIRKSSFISVFPLSLTLAACGEAPPLESEGTTTDFIGARSQALTEDALASAYQSFKQEFLTLGRHQSFDVGLAPLPALGTEDLGRAALVIDFAQGPAGSTGAFTVRPGEYFELPPELGFALWAGRNVAGPGRSARPENGDDFVLLGTLSAEIDGTRSFNGVGFDWNRTDPIDFLLLSRVDANPGHGGVALANLTLFEKRFFAEQFGWILPVPAGVPSAAVPTTDPLVQRGFQVFFEETFAGNGRTCGTCHRAENNFTIDEALIATLPPSDPLFQAALDVPGLEGLDPSAPLREIQNHGLILENLDGFLDAPPVFRSVQHTLGLSATTTRPRGTIVAGQELVSPPDERTGWSGDGSPGRGTLHDFAIGAIVQHLTRDVERRPQIDFRLPTQEELDALEAFQLSLGRKREVQVRQLVFTEPAAEMGKVLFNGPGLCFVCHDNAGARSNGPAIFNNVDVDQGVERRPETAALGLTPDAGFGTAPRFAADGTFLGFGTGDFNVQSLIEAADTAPFFHNNSAATLEDAVRHYTTSAFESEPAGFGPGVRPQLNEAQVQDVAAFLRVLNAAENVRQARERLVFVRDHQTSPANGANLTLALAEIEDALEVLDQPGRALAPSTRHVLLTLKQIVELSIAQPPAGQSAYAGVGVTWAELFVGGLFSQNPLGEFLE